MWALCSTAVAVLVTGCYSKPDFAGARDAGPDAPIDAGPLAACAWPQFANIRTYLPLDEPSGSANVIDMSMAANNGQTVGALMLGMPGKIGTAAYYVDGADAALRLNSLAAFDNLTELTVCAWVFLDRLPVVAEISSNIVDKSLNGYDRGWNLYVEVASGARVGFLTPWGHYVAGQDSVAANRWMHICATWDGSDGPEGIRLYRDGVLDPVARAMSLNKTMREDDSLNNLVLGRSATTPNLYSLYGKLDEFFLFEAVLSPEQINSLYRCAP